MIKVISDKVGAGGNTLLLIITSEREARSGLRRNDKLLTLSLLSLVTNNLKEKTCQPKKQR